MAEFKKISQEIFKKIKNSKNILLTLHSGPDGDSVGSCLSMYFALKQLNKEVTLIGGDSDLPLYLSATPGFENISQKNITQVDIKDFDLILFLDTPSLRQVSRQIDLDFLKDIYTISIDHHKSGDDFVNLKLVDQSQPANCQFLYKIYKEWGITITPEIAGALFIGIFTDTGAFKNSNTNYKSLEIAAKLAKINKDFTKILFEMDNSDSPDRLKSLAAILNNIEVFFDGRVAIASLSYKEMKKNKINYKTTESLNVANMLKSVKGWDIGISLVEFGDKNVKVSFRTRDPKVYDLSFIAASTGTGGGHRAAAGATISKTIKASKNLILKTISKIHPELGTP